MSSSKWDALNSVHMGLHIFGLNLRNLYPWQVLLQPNNPNSFLKIENKKRKNSHSCMQRQKGELRLRGVGYRLEVKRWLRGGSRTCAGEARDPTRKQEPTSISAAGSPPPPPAAPLPAVEAAAGGSPPVPSRSLPWSLITCANFRRIPRLFFFSLLSFSLSPLRFYDLILSFSSEFFRLWRDGCGFQRVLGWGPDLASGGFVLAVPPFRRNYGPVAGVTGVYGHRLLMNCGIIFCDFHWLSWMFVCGQNLAVVSLRSF